MDALFERYNDTLAVSLSGEIDQYAVARIKSKIDVEIEESGKLNLVFDLSRVDFMDSSGIGLIIGRYKKITPIGGKVKISGANERIRKIIELSGLMKIINIYPNIDAALKKGEE